MKHVIKKQVIQLKLLKRDGVFHVQHKISRDYYENLLPILESAFDRYSDETEIIFIDKLEIDIGILSMEQVDKFAWGDIFQKLLDDQLKKIAAPGDTGRAARGQPLARGHFRQWMFYMKNGYLPWNAVEINAEWYTRVLKTLATEFDAVAELRAGITESPVVVARIVEQHDKEFLSRLVTLITAKNHDALDSMIKAIAEMLLIIHHKQAVGETFNLQSLYRRLWRQVFVLSARRDTANSTIDLCRHLLIETLTVSQLELLSKQPSGSHQLHSIVAELWKEELAKRKSTSEEPDLKARERPFPTDIDNNVPATRDTEQSNNDPGEETKEILSADELIGPTSSQRKVSRDEDGIGEEGVFVSHCGIILLHPFLRNLFRANDLLNETKFKSQNAHTKALYLLHFLGTGNIGAAEHELIIPKVLTGYPAHLPVEKDCVLDESELKECNDLLVAVLSHWTAVGKTSAEGLRVNFLQRPGKLFTKNEQLRMQVEPASYDMLLDRLPWSINMIRLPWMRKVLHVEWR